MINCSESTTRGVFGDCLCGDDGSIISGVFSVDSAVCDAPPTGGFVLTTPDCGCSSGGGSSNTTGRALRPVYRDDLRWADDLVTYNEPAWIGVVFRVFFNEGNRYLDERDGFYTLTTGGFTTDSSLFVLLSGQQLIVTF